MRSSAGAVRLDRGRSGALRFAGVLFLLGEVLQPLYGPFRLFTSHIFLAGAAIVLSGLVTWRLLPVVAATIHLAWGIGFFAVPPVVSNTRLH